MRKQFHNSILFKVLLPMFLVILIQSVLFFGIITEGKVMQRLNENAYDILNERVINRARELEFQITQKWTQVDAAVIGIEELRKQYLQKNKLTMEDFKSDKHAKKEFLQEATPSILKLLRQNNVNGTFLILAGEEGATRPKIGEAQTRQGICMRDLDQNSGYQDDRDILMERSPVDLARSLGYTLDSWWESVYTFDAEEDNEYFFKPMEGAINHPEYAYEDLGYWCVPHYISEKDMAVMSYSVPLLDENRVPYAVLGIEVTTNYITSLLPSEELGGNNTGIYVLAGVQENTLSTYVSDGYIYKKLFGNDTKIQLKEPTISDSCFVLSTNHGSDEACGSVQYLQLYNKNTPYENERIALIGIMEKNKLLGFNLEVRNSIVAAILISLFLGFFGILMASRVITKPITILVEKVKKIDPEKGFLLEKIGISEIDQLTEAIADLGQNVADNQAKLSTIIRMSKLEIGAFEVNLKTGKVFCTEEFFEVLEGIFPMEYREKMTEHNFFREMIQNLSENSFIVEEENVAFACQMKKADGSQRWIRIRCVNKAENTLGIIMDVTGEFLEKQKLEHERDHDILTDLYNRRAFNSILTQLFEQPEDLGVAAMIMMDIDNLKYMNDTYGHDYGDEYIRAAAMVLRQFADQNCLLARISGDEFLMFLYHGKNKGEIREKIDQIKEEIHHSTVDLDEIKSVKIRLSGGVSWYPEDATQQKDLIRFADFAMYQVKKSIKGEFCEFDLENYHKNSYLLQYGDELNRFIEEELVEYSLQPIVNVKTGEIFAYEALMRPRGISMKSPKEILALARTQGRLSQVECLTWKKALEKFRSCTHEMSDDCKFFINSVPNQMLAEVDANKIYELYGDLFGRVVLEITEEDHLYDELMATFLERMVSRGCELAIDDYGTGYNGQKLLVDLNPTPNYVKLDMSIVRNIDKDPNRQEVVHSLLEYTETRNIKVIAEGVETFNELDFLRKAGIEYVQGFLLQEPSSQPLELSANVKKLLIQK